MSATHQPSSPLALPREEAADAPLPTPMRFGLVDSFARPHSYLRVSVTDRCNFRCGYCMPVEGIVWRRREELLTDDEIVSIIRLFVRHGVTKVRLTGGEPTVRPGLVELIGRISTIDGIESLGLTTNAYDLERLASPLRDAGVQVINISIDSLRRDRFLAITRRDHFDDVMAGIRAALAAGYPSVKLNVVVMAGVNADEILDFVELTREWPITVRFIEFMPFKSNGWQKAELYPYAAMVDDIQTRYEIEAEEVEPHAVARTFRVSGHRGKIGFIASMTRSFCAGCNRLRLTADGKFKPCLFSVPELDLRDALRGGATEEELVTRIRAALWNKQREHPPMELLQQQEGRSMVEIGG